MANVSFRWNGQLHTFKFNRGDLTEFMHIRGILIPEVLGRVEAQVLMGSKNNMQNNTEKE